MQALLRLKEKTIMILDRLDRPLAVFDIEATGLNRKLDRLIDLCVIVIQPGGERATHNFRVHPQCKIPAESIAIHGITDEDVKDCPPFSEVVDEIDKVFKGADLCGYNLLHFDIPLLEEEYIRSDRKFHRANRRVLDAQRIYHKREPRDLSAALMFYANEVHSGAHGAEADVVATIKVLEGQYKKYDDLPADMDAADEFCNPRDPSWADRNGMLKVNAKGDIMINFGKKSGRLLKDLARQDRQFLKWICKGDFPHDMQEIVSGFLKNNQFGGNLKSELDNLDL